MMYHKNTLAPPKKKSRFASALNSKAFEAFKKFHIFLLLFTTLLLFEHKVQLGA